ncbi:hypothetical protein SBRCBS47491_007511 [Sporothrix bragantina]|uniref:Integral membrane protein n=1 Tax=Sporothrix bragantina TaxID=671064 RepID=A0ABP0CDR5_9PEZI
MSGYPPYQSNPPQRRPVPGQQAPQQTPPQQQQQQQTYSTPPPPPAAPAVQAPPYQQQQQPTYQTAPQAHPQAHAYPHQSQYQQPQYQQQQYLSPDGNQQAPSLPPRPPGGAGPFLAKTYLSFPPPPRSPNRPPVLPPRPQASPQPQQQAYAQQPIYGQPAQPGYAPAVAQAPVYGAAPTASPAPAAYQQGYYPPPPPPPPPQHQQQAAAAPAAAPYDPYAAQAAQATPAQPAAAYPPTNDQVSLPHYVAPAQAPVPADQKQPTSDSVPSPAPVPVTAPGPVPAPTAAQAPPPTPTAASTSAPPQEYATSYNYYEPPVYPTAAAQSAPAAASPAASPDAPPATQTTPAAQYQTPADHAAVSPATPASAMPVVPAVPVSPEHTGDSMQQMNSMLQGMSIGSGAVPAELPAFGGPDRQTTPAAQPAPSPQPAQSAYHTPAAQPVYAAHPTPLAQAQGHVPPPPPQATQQPPPPPPQASPQPAPQSTAQPATSPQPAQARSESDYPDPQYNQENYVPPNYAEAGYAHQPSPAPAPTPAAAPTSDASRGAAPHVVDPPFRPVISCIDNPMSFNTWWYTNPNAPDFYICSKCYMDYLYPTQFQNHFEVRYMRDGAKRHCRFKVPRITDQLLLDAVARGSLDGLIAYMNQRVAIPDCKKTDGAKGGQGLKWFRAKNDAIPGLVICEACFQDIACLSPFAYNFEPSPPHNNASEVWACDLAVAFIRKEFDERSKTNDWPSFCNESTARLGMQPCPKNTQVMISLRKWFTPVPGKGPEDAVLCAACYCDRVLHTGQEAFWQQMPHDPIFSKKYTSNCCSGLFNILMAFSAASDTENWPQFWRSLNRLAFEEKACVPAGIVDGNWYTLPSQPPGFSICGGCHAGIVESLSLQQFFVPVHNHPAPGTAVVCSMNVNAPRFVAYVDKLLETWFTQDCTSWVTFARRYANIPPCCRDTDYKGRAWYGWPECTICAECYLEFVQGTALDTAAMPMRPQILGEARICDMYSPRMRALYLEACKSPATGLQKLLNYSAQRRLVYFETMPTCRNIVVQQKLTAQMAGMARLQSVAYTGAGNLLEISSNHHDHTYGQAGVGYGFDNMQQLQGARYNVQANQLSAQVGGANILLVGQLENRWRSVE